MAGGLSKDGVASGVSIYRREGTVSKVIRADLDRIKRGSSEDVMLEAFDIVDVPRKGREPRKLPPVVDLGKENSADRQKLPLRIVE